MVLLRRYLLLLIALLLMSFPTVFAQDTLVNLVQWPSSVGGNDHWYAVIALARSWVAHDTLARTLVHDGYSGYLATITSPEENQFIVDQVIHGVTPNVSYDEYYLGGFRSYGWFRWQTNEAMTYTNWDSGEPSGDGPVVAILGWTYGATLADQIRQKGKWNDEPNGTSTIGTPTRLWAIIEWGSPDVVPSDTLVKLIQWPVSQGGNDHWYAVMARTRPWVVQDSIARTYVHDGLTGYLASITSPEENQFIVDNVIKGLVPDAVYDEYYIGGVLTGYRFNWLTGEPWSFSHWDDGEPSGDGPAMAIWGWAFGAEETDVLRQKGKWNDVPKDTVGLGPLHQLWAVIEWGEPVIPPPPPPGPADSLFNLVQWPVSQGGNDHWYAVIGLTRTWMTHRALAETYTHSGITAHLATITSPEENQFIVDHVIRGVRAQAVYDEYYIGGIKVDNTWTWITAELMSYSNFDANEPSGDGPAAAIWGWEYGATAEIAELRRLGKWNDVPEDTTDGRVSIQTLWSIIEWENAQYTCGDVNNDGAVNSDDLDDLLAYYFMYGPLPQIPAAADINGSGVLDVGDVVALAAYLNGQLPSPCSTQWLFDGRHGEKRGGPTGLEGGTSGN